jgi:hypothetical protein
MHLAGVEVILAAHRPVYAHLPHFRVIFSPYDGQYTGADPFLNFHDRYAQVLSKRRRRSPPSYPRSPRSPASLCICRHRSHPRRCQSGCVRSTTSVIVRIGQGRCPDRPHARGRDGRSVKARRRADQPALLPPVHNPRRQLRQSRPRHGELRRRWCPTPRPRTRALANRSASATPSFQAR